MAGSLFATQDLIADGCCRIPEDYPGADGGTIVAGFLVDTQDLIDDCCCRILAGNSGADGELLFQDPSWLLRI